MRSDSAVRQQSMHRALHKRVRGQVAGVLGRDELFEYRRVGDQPAETQTRGDNFRECAQVDHIASVIAGLERRRRGVVIEVNEASRIVLDNGQVVRRGDAQQRPTLFRAQAAAGRVLIRGHAVQELRAVALDQRWERFHAQSVAFDWHADDARAARPKCFKGAQKAGLFDQDRIAGGDEHLGGQVDALLTAAGDADGVGVDVEAALYQELRDRGTEGWISLSGADLQGAGAALAERVPQGLAQGFYWGELQGGDARGEGDDARMAG